MRVDPSVLTKLLSGAFLYTSAELSLAIQALGEVSEHPETKEESGGEQQDKRQKLKDLLDRDTPNEMGGLGVEVDVDVFSHVSHLVT